MSRVTLTPWILEMLRAKQNGTRCTPRQDDKTRDAPVDSHSIAQLLSTSKHPSDAAAIKCVLSDGTHCIGAVLSPACTADVIAKGRVNPDDLNRRLDDAIVYPVDLPVVVNLTRRHFSLVVDKVTVVSWGGQRGRGPQPHR